MEGIYRLERFHAIVTDLICSRRRTHSGHFPRRRGLRRGHVCKRSNKRTCFTKRQVLLYFHNYFLNFSLTSITINTTNPEAAEMARSARLSGTTSKKFAIAGM